MRMCHNLSRKDQSSTSLPYRRHKIKWLDSDDLYGFMGRTVLYENDNGVFVRGILKKWTPGDNFNPPLWQVACTSDNESPRTFFLREVVHTMTEDMKAYGNQITTPQKKKERIAKHRKEHYEANKKRIAKQRKEHYEANKKRIAKQQKEYRKNNKEKIAKKKKEWYEVNKERTAKKDKEWYEANKEKIAKQKKEHYEANKEKIAKQRKEHYEANKERITKQQREYRKEKKNVLRG